MREEQRRFNCSNCKSEMESGGIHWFRVEGPSHIVLFSPGISELLEKAVPLHVYICRKCRKIELVIPTEEEMKPLRIRF